MESRKLYRFLIACTGSLADDSLLVSRWHSVSFKCCARFTQRPFYPVSVFSVTTPVDGAYENVNSYNVTTLGKRYELYVCRLARGCNFTRDNVTNASLSLQTVRTILAVFSGRLSSILPSYKTTKLLYFGHREGETQRKTFMLKRERLLVLAF